MSSQINYGKQSPDLHKKLFDLSTASNATLEPKLLDLIHIRASQLNGCAFCLDMHVKEAKIHGERELRLYHLSVWRESPLFSEKERAALDLTEAVTKLNGHISEEVHTNARNAFSEKEVSDLVFAVCVINFWNRLNIFSPATPGSLDQMLGLTKADLK